MGGCTIFKLGYCLPLSAIVLFALQHSSALALPQLAGIEFSIQPRLCVLSEQEERCEDELEIRWTAGEPRALCLYRSDKQLPLRCWENELSGSHRFSLSAAANVTFSLREVDQNLLLASAEFEVVRDEPRYRRKRRNPWSFF